MILAMNNNQSMQMNSFNFINKENIKPVDAIGCKSYTYIAPISSDDDESVYLWMVESVAFVGGSVRIGKVDVEEPWVCFGRRS